MQIGVVRKINANETVSNITEHFTADLFNAWLTDLLPMLLPLFNLAFTNFKIMKQLAVNMTDNGIKEYKKESTLLKVAH